MWYPEWSESICCTSTSYWSMHLLGVLANVVQARCICCIAVSYWSMHLLGVLEDVVQARCMCRIAMSYWNLYLLGVHALVDITCVLSYASHGSYTSCIPDCTNKLAHTDRARQGRFLDGSKCGAGKVHEGMMAAATFVHCNTAAALQAAAQKHPGWPLIVTGHSMGGNPF